MNALWQWTFFGFVLRGIGMKTDLYQSCGHCWLFQICWHIWCSNLTTSSFRIWNSSARIPSTPLALFVVMLPKAHLNLHSRLSGSRWVTTSLIIWVTKAFFYIVFFCVFLSPFLISSILMVKPGKFLSLRKVLIFL